MIKQEIDRNFIWHPYASAQTPPPVCGAGSSNGAEIILEENKRTMSKKETIKFIVQIIASVATAIVTALGATSCMGV